MSVQFQLARSRAAKAAAAAMCFALISGCETLKQSAEPDDDLPFLPPPTLAKPLPPVPPVDVSQIPGYEPGAPRLAAAEGEELEPVPVPRAPLSPDCEAIAGSSFSECPAD